VGKISVAGTSWVGPYLMIAMMMSDAGGTWRFGQPGVMEGGRFFLAALVQFARQLLAARKHVVPLEAFQDEVVELFSLQTEILYAFNSV